MAMYWSLDLWFDLLDLQKSKCRSVKLHFLLASFCCKHQVAIHDTACWRELQATGSVHQSCVGCAQLKLWKALGFLSWLTWPSSSSRTLRNWSGHHLSQTKQSNNVRQILRQFKILQAGSRSHQKRCQNEFKIIQVFLLREQNHAKSHGIRSHKIAWSRMLQQIYDIPIYLI